MAQPEDEASEAPLEGEAALRSEGIAAVELGRARQGQCTYVALLVADRDLPTARNILRDIERSRFRLFSVSGIEGSAFRLDHPDYRALTLAVFPGELANSLLSRSRQDGELDASDRFRIAAYIRAYYGSAARLMGLEATAQDCQDPGWFAEAPGAAVDIFDRQGLHDLLSEARWCPSVDMLERLSLADTWIGETLLARLSDRDRIARGLSVFFCRSRAVEGQFLTIMESAIAATGFEILRSLPLDGSLAQHVETTTRGGNWGAGPFPVSGGPPVHLIIAADVFPLSPPASVKRKHPFLDNHRTLTAKLAAREKVFDDIEIRERFNPLHSTDTSAEALRVIRQIMPESEADALLARFTARLEEIRKLSTGADFLPGCNSVAATIRLDTPSGPRLRKIFRRQFRGLLPGIALAQDHLSGMAPEFLKIEERNDRYLDMSDPGQAYAPLASHRDTLPIKAILRVRTLLEQAADQDMRPMAFDPRFDILLSTDAGHIGLLPVFTRSGTAAARPLSAIVPGRSAASSAGPGYDAAWYPALKVPRSVFLSGHALSVLIFSRVVHPVCTAARNMRKHARKTAKHVRRRLKR